jgi:hypothetical protein
LNLSRRVKESPGTGSEAGQPASAALAPGQVLNVTTAYPWAPGVLERRPRPCSGALGAPSRVSWDRSRTRSVTACASAASRIGGRPAQRQLDRLKGLGPRLWSNPPAWGSGRVSGRAELRPREAARVVGGVAIVPVVGRTAPAGSTRIHERAVRSDGTESRRPRATGSGRDQSADRLNSGECVRRNVSVGTALSARTSASAAPLSGRRSHPGLRVRPAAGPALRCATVGATCLHRRVG